ncbi:uncharacterized protein TRUGW13939_11518 [Talaromyces rugulosus]|uniref:Uncharacterized protein n=1 Tax=Talaromyces rugulosus TaxID=121627 RepID=A0A7H8RD47_TALRU|nr:uncharacterized protein TRUGW13939_11518 [Talaromyces rugulosus]QKX64344.1 hypothetical protein TRUGW13939_11518 [Talaromyces rugulosus]
MVASKPEWLLAPRDIKPNTTITLGKLICNPAIPEGPPYLAPALPIPPNATSEFNYPWTREVSHEQSGMIGIFASFMASFGIGGDASAQFERQHKSRVEVARLQTVKFEPGDEYLQRTLNLPANLGFLKETRFRKPIYVVTGVKVAYGGRTSRSNAKALGGEGSIGLNPAVPGLQLGPKAGLSQKIEESALFAPKGEVCPEMFTKGAVFSQEAALDEDIPMQLEKAEIDDNESGVELLGLEEECSGQDEFGLNGHDALDESGEACILVAP